jgi:cytochrome c553
MKPIRSSLTILAVVIFSVAALAGGPEISIPGKRFADNNCSWCHGSSGQGYTIAPRLAGQRRQYIENQLRDFFKHARDNPFSQQYMWGVRGAPMVLSPETVQDLADYFSRLHPEAACDGDARLAAQGQIFYRDGIPRANIPSCVACHGPNAEGVREFPRLGGLSYYYLKRKLREWGEGYHAAAVRPMPGVASKMSDEEIEAVASYLSFIQ